MVGAREGVVILPPLERLDLHSDPPCQLILCHTRILSRTGQPVPEGCAGGVEPFLIGLRGHGYPFCLAGLINAWHKPKTSLSSLQTGVSNVLPLRDTFTRQALAHGRRDHSGE